MVHLDIILILGLTTDGKRSMTGKILRYRIVHYNCCDYSITYYLCISFLPDPRGAGLHEAFQILSVRPSVRASVRASIRLHIRFQFYPTRSIYLGPQIFLQITDLLCTQLWLCKKDMAFSSFPPVVSPL